MRRNVEEEDEEDEDEQDEYEEQDEQCDEWLQRVLGVICVRSGKNDWRFLFMQCHNAHNDSSLKPCVCSLGNVNI